MVSGRGTPDFSLPGCPAQVGPQGGGPRQGRGPDGFRAPLGRILATPLAQGYQTSSDGMLSTRNRVSDQLRVYEISSGDMEVAQGVNISARGTRLG